MHKLEYAILAVSAILENQPEKYKALAEELANLASVSHNYEPPKSEILDISEEKIADLHERADDFIHGK